MAESECGMASIRVLLIEDDASFGRLVLSSLAMIEGIFHVETVDCVSDALDLLNDRAFNIVLLDLNLPDSSGLDTLDAIHAANRKLPIVVLTGIEEPEIEAEALTRGAQQFLCKTKLEDLVEAMRKAVTIRLHEPAKGLSQNKGLPEVENLLKDLDESIKASKQAVSILDNRRRDPAEKNAVRTLHSHLGKMESRISLYRNDGK